MKSLLLATLLLPLAVHAGCSRPIDVPLAALGQTVNVQGADISGIYPDILRTISVRSGCQFRFRGVSRAQQQALFETGKADLLAPALRTPQRDRYGSFVPMMQLRPMLVTVDPRHPPVTSLAQLRDATSLRLAVMRGFDFGDAFQAFIRDMQRAGRTEPVDDIVSAARLIQSGYVDGIIMPPVAIASSVQNEPRISALQGRLRLHALAELPWTDNGVYLSRTTLSDADRRTLEQALAALARTSSVWDNYRRYYPAEIVTESVRPLR
ncbi:ABC transporter substrate-binding protein [Massilia sp. TS11]|uniref:substrate-binding periplasmic protein n=1 Tax=Massilia sp. TS11 TaxID=2908003 RepID=UPI001EDB1D76|nr:transporter substrate-binding domain-containing protein [Massilia sp. TS11]MCG2584508.1 transporter substrate-binding domain-containing protein [Massilia sp. TS11]